MERFFLRRGRGGAVVDEVLGESFEGILVSDFYASYDHYPGLKQRCWAHPRSGSGAGSAAGHSRAEGPVPGRRRAGPVGIGSATALRQRPGMGGGRGRPLSRGQLALEDRLLALCRPFLEDPLAVQARLCRRIERHIKSLPRT